MECNLVWNHMGHLKIKQACKASFIWNLKGVLKLNYEVELPLYYIHFEITKFSGSDTGFLVYTNIESWTVYKRWVTKSWPAIELTSSMKPLSQSWSVMLKDLVHQKTKRRVWKLFWKPVSMCCTDLKLCTREGWLIAGLKWSRLQPQSLFFSLALGC